MYISFKDFSDLSPIDKKLFHHKYTASKNGRNYLLLQRYGEYQAQVELTFSRLYRGFLGYSPEIEIVKNGDEYYVASEVIEGFKTWSEVHGLFKVGVPVQEDGSVLVNGKPKKLIGFGAISTLAYVFANGDMNSDNIGVVETEDAFIAWIVDLPDHLDEEILGLDITQDDLDVLPGVQTHDALQDWELMWKPLDPKVIRSEYFQSELRAMLKKITDTPITEIRRKLEKGITASEYQQQMNFRDFLIAEYGAVPEDSDESDSEQSVSLEDIRQKIDFRSKLGRLEIRHSQLTQLLQHASSSESTPLPLASGYRASP